MAASKEDIVGWFKSGKEQGYTHMIVVCDTYDWDDYPVYVSADENARDKYAEYTSGKHSMQKVMEVYNLSQNMDKQMSQRRALEF